MANKNRNLMDLLLCILLLPSVGAFLFIFVLSWIEKQIRATWNPPAGSDVGLGPQVGDAVHGLVALAILPHLASDGAGQVEGPMGVGVLGERHVHCKGLHGTDDVTARCQAAAMDRPDWRTHTLLAPAPTESPQSCDTLAGTEQTMSDWTHWSISSHPSRQPPPGLASLTGASNLWSG